MVKIIDEIVNNLPKDKISDACFEGANIVIYTKDKAFFLEQQALIKKIVDDIKKRIELRPDPSICMEMEAAEKAIRKLIPEDATISNIIFDPQRSIVIIESEKPGLVIGKMGSILQDIREKTFWVPQIKRTPAIRSELIENIRSVLYMNSDYRRKFLDKIGHRIYDGWIREKKKEWIRVTYLGGGREVGRSCMLLQTPESRVMLDCGINVANENDAFPMFEAPEFNLQDLDAVIVSHSHLDHSGFVPYLFKFGYRGPVYCTAPTRDVMSLLLLDYIKIMHSEGKEPIYSTDDIKEMVKHTVCLDFGEVSDITPDVRLTLYNSGHILGAAMAHLHIGNGLHNLLYTGDMKFAFTHLLDAAVTEFPRLETLMVESTYGGRDNVLPPEKEVDTMLKDIIVNTVNRDGKVLIPVLGSGRAQEVMIMIESLVRKGELKEIPVYIDGMVWDVTAIHTAYPEFLNTNIRKAIFHRDQNPFLSPIFKRVGSKKERKQIVEDTGPCVILATSGMFVGGPSVQYLKELCPGSQHSLVFSCYQAEGSLGRRIQGGVRDVVFTDTGKPEQREIRMEVHKLEFTNHSDRRQLMSFVHKCNPKPKKILINHGESSRCLDLASSIHKMNKIETICPRNLDAVRIR